MPVVEDSRRGLSDRFCVGRARSSPDPAIKCIMGGTDKDRVQSWQVDDRPN